MRRARPRWIRLLALLLRRYPLHPLGGRSFATRSSLALLPDLADLTFKNFFKVSPPKKAERTASCYDIQCNISINARAFGNTEVKSMTLHWNQEPALDILNSFDVIVSSVCPKRDDSPDKFLEKKIRGWIAI